jgi:hypothetical protein
VSVRLPSPQYDSLYHRAQQQRVSVSDIIRRKLDEDADD